MHRDDPEKEAFTGLLTEAKDKKPKIRTSNAL